MNQHLVKNELDWEANQLKARTGNGQRKSRVIVLCCDIVLLYYCVNCVIVLGVPPTTRSAVFLNIVQKAFDLPPPLRFEHYVAKFFDGFFKKRVNVSGETLL